MCFLSFLSFPLTLFTFSIILLQFYFLLQSTFSLHLSKVFVDSTFPPGHWEPRRESWMIDDYFLNNFSLMCKSLKSRVSGCFSVLAVLVAACFSIPPKYETSGSIKLMFNFMCCSCWCIILIRIALEKIKVFKSKWKTVLNTWIMSTGSRTVASLCCSGSWEVLKAASAYSYIKPRLELPWLVD